ncbi:MAG: threonine ammonia-lyase [Oscillospiraceae bacterium]|nr:threonine ammonia-lyase [Oscillospiraceae bacterium]
MLTLDRVYQAAHLLKSCVRKTDVIPYANLQSGCELYLKAENLQLTGSFKVRGAYFKIANLSEEDQAKGVIACSAGNHAQGVALAAQRMGISATIFIPSIAPLSKVEATKSYGADVRLVDGVYDDAFGAATAYQKETGGILIHPFDDPDVIAGQGTIGLELLDQIPNLDAIVAPVGGGGLISGIAFAVKKLNPACKVYGVQAAGAGSMYYSHQKKERTCLEKVSTFADGIAVKVPGCTTFELCEQYVDKIVTVTDDEVATAILTLMEQQKLVAEGAGAVAVASVLFDKLPLEGKKVCAIVSGGNIDVNILSRVIRRGLLTTGRLSELTLEMLDKPGQLREVSTIIADAGANVTKVLHDPSGENTDITGCYLHISMETKNKDHFAEVKRVLEVAGYRVISG